MSRNNNKKESTTVFPPQANLPQCSWFNIEAANKCNGDFLEVYRRNGICVNCKNAFLFSRKQLRCQTISSMSPTSFQFADNFEFAYCIFNLSVRYFVRNIVHLLWSSALQSSERVIITFITLFALIQPATCFVNFFSKDDLKYTFGVTHSSKVPHFKHIYPRIEYSRIENYTVRRNTAAWLHFVNFNGVEETLKLESATADLLSDRVTVVKRQFRNGGGSLHVGTLNGNIVSDAFARFDDCHYSHQSNHTYAAISNCDDDVVKGIIVRKDGIYVIHPIPERHAARMKRSTTAGGGKAAASRGSPHVIYKRSLEQQDFCGIENTITTEQLDEDEAGVLEDAFVVGEKLQQDSELTVELGVFVDETLWRQFSSKHGTAAWQKLQQYSVTMLNNIQIMYKQPTAVPRLIYRIVRYEVFMAQPNVLAPHLHDYGHAQKYLDMFCRYQRSLGIRDWDHAILLTGYDIHRGSGSRSISGIARLDGMCDPWNTCTLAEGLDFTAAFIGTHELGHSVGMRHDEPYCQSRFIMSASLGPGKVTWSTCSLRDYHTFLQRLDAKGKNCLRTSILREKIPIENYMKPGQLYDANLQCSLMHGTGYIQVAPRQDHYDGICYMMWCGQSTFGRIITSHPALEGTFCGESKWCELGRCVPWTGFGAPLPLRPTLLPPRFLPASTPAPTVPTVPPTVATTRVPLVAQPARVDGQWSGWSATICSQCYCAPIAGAIGITLSTRTCNAPAPLNGGAECEGSMQRAAVCARQCNVATKSVNEYVSAKCVEHKRVKADAELTGTGSQLSRYPQRACKVFCDVITKSTEKNYRFYGDSLPDGTPCGWNRYCVGGECLNLSCEDSALLPRDVGCPKAAERCAVINDTQRGGAPGPPPPPRGQWTTWSVWSACSVSCGPGGYQLRSRACSVANGCEGAPNERAICNAQPCPTGAARNAEPTWTDWTSWNQCSVSCGRGSQARYRRCQTAQLTIAFTCPGQIMDIRDCDELACAATVATGVGDWAEWSAWSACSTTCGPSTQSRSRNCKKEPCDGSGQQRMACNLRECGNWNDWGSWTECSSLCGKGLRSRSRLCPTGAQCPGPAIDQGFCNEQPCAPDSSSGGAQLGQWSSWFAWSACSLSCGAGVKRRTRHCQNGNCPGVFRESAICNEAICSVSDANWGGWGYWSTCSETCGNGVRRRLRKCYGSGNCYGNEHERENCNLRSC